MLLDFRKVSSFSLKESWPEYDFLRVAPFLWTDILGTVECQKEARCSSNRKYDLREEGKLSEEAYPSNTIF